MTATIGYVETSCAPASAPAWASPARHDPGRLVVLDGTSTPAVDRADIDTRRHRAATGVVAALANPAIVERLAPGVLEALEVVLSGLDPRWRWGADCAAALEMVEAGQAVAAFATATTVMGVAAYHDEILAQIHEDIEGRDPAIRVGDPIDEADRATVAELTAAVGWSATASWRAVAWATRDRLRHAPVVDRLRAGSLDEPTARRILAATTGCPSECLPALIDRVLALNPDGSRPSYGQVGRRLSKEAAALDEQACREEQDRAVARRGVWAHVQPDGTGTLTITSTTSAIVAAAERLDAVARALRSGGDHRTVSQLRSDAALDLLHRGVLVAPVTVAAAAQAKPSPAHASPSPAPAVPGPAHSNPSPTPSSPAPAPAAPGPAHASPASAPAVPGAAGLPMPPARVTVIVGLETLMGLDDNLAGLPGYGFVTASQARDIAFAPGSVWARLVTDHHGVARAVGTHRYRPDAATTRLVQHRDTMCRAPGCTTPAVDCDLDHQIPFPAGDTHPSNLAALHRAHHNLKTLRLWASRLDERDGAITWTTPARRSYTTRLHDHRADLRPPPDTPDPPF